jgi:DNA polymerase III subunit gamma/tau
MEKFKHKVLALKYRPKNFNELIGQNIMVETITNSIKLNKVPNAYLFTGIRGVGKTTTARIVAKSLNCKNGITNLCSDIMCEHCTGITNSNHLDVLEMDAASKTGIDDIRELIESSKYNPTSAKFKIFIIDEIHMLSKQAFNGLLKTLEEPPPHLKFIFATTDVKKIPITVVSRCQRFDLHRVTIEVLFQNLKKILVKENGQVSDGALKLIAKASEGSVRDSLSLLDRALISQNINKSEVDEAFVRKMLGIADKSKILELINLIFQGDKKKSIEALRIMIDEGIEPSYFLNDLLESIYLIQQRKNIGNFESDLSISETEIKMIELISKDVNISTLILFWQFIIKVLDELTIVSNPILSLEMLIIRLIHLKDMPSYEKVLDLVNQKESNKPEINRNFMNEELIDEKKITNEEVNISKISKNQIKNTIQTKPELKAIDIKQENRENILNEIASLEDLIQLTSKKKEIELKYDLERNVNLIKFSNGKIDISFNENLAKNFVKDLSERLLEWTGKRWLITLTKAEGQKTFLELQSLKKDKFIEEVKKGDTYKKFKNVFPDSELIEVIKKD